MAGELNELSEAIGGLRAEVRLLSNGFLEEREAAADHRTETRAAISDLSHKTTILASQVEEMKPHWIDYRNSKEQDKGASNYRNRIRAVGYAAAAAIGGGLTYAAEAMKLFASKPPHP